MKYKINPVKATCEKYKDKENSNFGIIGLNDTCFGICSAYSGTNDIYSIDPQCAKSCEDFIEKRKHEIFGVGSCDHQVPYRPVIWEQYPRNFPKLLKEFEPNTALQKCYELCDTKSPHYSAQCRNDCLLDYNAVEMIDEPNLQNIRVNSIKPIRSDSTIEFKATYNPFVMLAIFVIFVLWIMYVYRK